MDLTDIKTNCVAVLTSGGGHATESQLQRDYRNLIGQSIPFTKHGFSTLRELLESAGGFYFTRNNLGEVVINQGFDPKTAHISSLIARQKKKPGSSKGKKRMPSFRCYARPSYPGPSQVRFNQPPRPRIMPRQPILQPLSGPPIIPQRQSISPLKVKAQQLISNSGPPIIPQRQPILPKSKVQQPPISKQTSNSCPPIIPQRQPLSSVQQRLVKTGPSLNVQAVQSQIVSVHTNGYKEKSDAKEQLTLEEPSEDPNFKDIQWLEGKVRKTSLKPKSEKVPVTSSGAAAVAPVAMSATPAVTHSPAPILTLKTKSKTLPPKKAKTSPPPTEVTFKSYVTDLYKLSTKYSLECPVYKVLECPGLGRKIAYVAKVKIGDTLNVSSYPDEKPTSEEAQELVAKLACEELSRRLNPDLPSECLESDSLIDRVYKIVAEKSNGMFDDAVLEAYEKNHKIRLPPKWLELIASSPRFTLENLAGKFIIYPNTTAPEETYPSKSNGTSSPPEKLSIDINANRVVKEECPVMRNISSLNVPEGVTWDLLVTSVSSNEVWIRFIGEEYDGKYNNQMNDLEMKLLSDSKPATAIVVDEFYVAKFDNCWLRVQLKELVEDTDECVVFLIDNGEVDTIPVTELYVLDDEFLSLPPQAFKCRLAYVDLRFTEAQAYVSSNVIGFYFVAEVLVPATDSTMASLVLYNTEKENPINANFNILNAIIESLSVPQLSLRTVSVLHLTHVEKGCLPWVQMEGRDLDLLELVLDDLSNLDLVQLHGVNAHPRVGHTGNMVLVRSSQQPKTWRRGVVLPTPNKDFKSPLVHFVDYGYDEKCMWSDIFDMEKVLPGLKKFPHQAFQINLHGLTASQLVDGVVKRLRELTPETVLAKVTDEESRSVELFRRLQPDNMIASINGDLTFNLDQYSQNSEPEPDLTETETSVVKASTCPLGSTHPLPQFCTLMDSEYFDVRVTISSNPFHFKIQPLSETVKFQELMSEMQNHYEMQHDILPQPAVQDFVENATFAAKSMVDMNWYRVSVVASMNATSTVLVRYCDFGDVGSLPVDRIRYLEPKFRNLPALAVSAKLHGVRPKNSDWSPEECVYFNNLVQDKSFVSRILAVNPEVNVPTTWKVSLDLCDTSGDTDIYVGAVMIEKGMAEPS